MPIVGTLILLVTAGAFMLQRALRQRYRDAHRATFGEVALQLAESGINVALANVGESIETPGTEIHTVLLTTTVDGINDVAIPIEAPALDELEALFRGDARVDVQLAFRGFLPFYPPEGIGGVAVDPREKFGEVAVISRAEYRGLARTFVATKRVKVVDVTAPVLSKFTLFLAENGGEDPNLLAYDRADPAAGFRLDGEPASPLVLYHRAERFPAVEGGKFLPLAPVLGEVAPDSGGLVYLGGESPWFLNLVHGIGAGRYEELFQLRRARYRIPSARAGVSNEYGITFGFYDGILRSGKFGSGAAPGGVIPRPDAAGTPVVDGTAALHLYGDTRNVSPTIVLGPAFRSYVVLRLLDGLWYPYRDAAEFSAMPGGGVFGGDYEAYREVMARVVHESYNRAYDHVVTNRELLGEGDVVEDEGTPFVPGPQLLGDVLARVHPVGGDEAYLYPSPGEPVAGALHLTRDMAGVEEDVFRGALRDLDGDLLEELLLAKAVHQVPDAATLLARHGGGGELDLPGIVLVMEGDLELGDVRVARPGMVLVPGNIAVTGAISAGDDAGPLTLVSLSGDVRIATDQAVRAHLVALRGQVSGRGKLEVHGAVAARRVDLRSLVRGPEEKTLTYDHALDPTVTASYQRHLRAYLDTELRLAIEHH